MISPRNELENPSRLDALKRLNRLDSRAEQNFGRLTRLAQQLLSAPISMFSLIDDSTQYIKAACGLPAGLAKAGSVPLSHSFCQYVVASVFTPACPNHIPRRSG